MATKKQNTITTTATNSTASQDTVQLSAVVQRLDMIVELLKELNANLPLKGIDTSRFVK